MMDTYRQGGAARVYWITLPTPRDADRQRIARVGQRGDRRRRRAVAGAGPRDRHRADLHARRATATRWRSTASETIVRESDGIHLNEAGATVLADALLSRINRDHHGTYGGRTP